MFLVLGIILLFKIIPKEKIQNKYIYITHKHIQQIFVYDLYKEILYQIIDIYTINLIISTNSLIVFLISFTSFCNSI